jgi:hypothetical protein
MNALRLADLGSERRDLEARLVACIEARRAAATASAAIVCAGRRLVTSNTNANNRVGFMVDSLMAPNLRCIPVRSGALC